MLTLATEVVSSPQTMLAPPQSEDTDQYSDVVSSPETMQAPPQSEDTDQYSDVDTDWEGVWFPEDASSPQTMQEPPQSAPQQISPLLMVDRQGDQLLLSQQQVVCVQVAYMQSLLPMVLTPLQQMPITQEAGPPMPFQQQLALNPMSNTCQQGRSSSF